MHDLSEAAGPGGGFLPTARRASRLLPALVLLATAQLAHASPPDETWQPGVYDDADFDDVVLIVTSSTSGPPPILLIWPLVWAVEPMSPPAEVNAAVPLPAPPLQGRAPPGPAAIL